MKRSINAETMLVLLVLVLLAGIAIGQFLVKWDATQRQLANHHVRLIALEQERQKRITFKAVVATVWGFVSHPMQKLALCLVRLW
jgi:hypothetical protein